MRNLFLLFLLTLAVTGCSTFGDEPIFGSAVPLGKQHLPWAERQAQLAKLHNWSTQGGVAIQGDQKGWNASFDWEQRYNNYALQVFGPLGINRIELAGSPGNATLTTPDKTYTSNSPEALLRQQLGWTLPVSNLNFWLRGLPAPNSPARRVLDSNNHLARLYQDGWELNYSRYASIEGIDLPDRIVLSNPRWQVRMVIHQWQLH